MPLRDSILERDHLGAFCKHTHVYRPGAGSGPLRGLTFGLKDIFDVSGHRTGFGSPDWFASHGEASTTATVARTLLDAGATLAGKTHTEEMAFSLTGENAHYGTPLNPAAPQRVPGGSSSGSAAAVAGRLVDFAIGSDTGGSVRAPASFCGIYGIRPTHGRISLDGACALAPIFDTVGWFARDAALVAQVGEVLLGGAPATAGRVLLAQDAFALALPGAADALAPAVARVTALLGDAEPVTVSAEGLPAWFDVFRVLQYDDIWRTHRAWITRVRPKFGPQVGPRFEAVAQVQPEEVAVMRDRRAEIMARLDELLAGNAVLLLPTVPDIAPLLKRPPAETVAFRERALALLCIAGLGGLPQVNLPFGTLNKCPIGLSMIAARGNDEMLLDIAARFGAVQHIDVRTAET
ncbi:amidase [Gemmatimonas groenlandica]|uniref:Amidase n=1 Tax=Gemmatimonas groenlandica TaxID=2732249 RepID=A0A6M4IM71_9BACT|nr:amidase [Gemmatimonas groenlandica]QJR35750.1 amidase [Gemmatimonas groenlandica]